MTVLVPAKCFFLNAASTSCCTKGVLVLHLVLYISDLVMYVLHLLPLTFFYFHKNRKRAAQRTSLSLHNNAY